MSRNAATVLCLVVIAVAAVLPLWMGPFYTRVVQFFFFSSALAIAWNILGGYAGYWSFGHTAFIGIGAFSAAHFVAQVGTFGTGPVSMIVPVLMAALICAAFAAVIAYPLLRLRGIYFAIVMLGVSQVVSELVNNVPWLQGGVGVFLPSPVPASMAPEVFFYYVFGALLLVTLLLSLLVRRSRFGYGLLAIREDEDTAMMLGVNTEQSKIAAFVLSSVLVGLLGAVYGYSVGYITTNTVFRLDFSLNMIVFCLIGGIGTLFGPVIGTAVMLILTQVVLSRFLDIHLLITGLAVVTIVLVVPGGILGALARPTRERATARAEPEPGS
jgi:branched-chain amino acid transport system permease protein